MTAAARLVDLLAENDNAHDGCGALGSSPRARAALAAPLTRPHAVPAAACRRFHTLGGERVLSSIVAVEQFHGAPRWRASVTIWGRSTAERRELALVLAQKLLSGFGSGEIAIEQRASVTFVRRALSFGERVVLAKSRLALAVDR